MGAALKVVVLGGSGVATPELASALAKIGGRSRPIELALTGRSPEKLSQVAGVARMLAGDEAKVSISYTTNTEAALEKADIVLNQVRVGGLEGRAFDETFPHEFGLPGEETVGPGGFANASRTIPVVLEYARMIEKICPQAIFLTFANPSSLVQYAISRYTSLRVTGLCDGPVHFCDNIAKALGLPLSELRIDYLGMHHFGWVTGVWHDGRSVLEEVIANAGVAAPDIDPAVTRALGVIPGPYLNYVFHPDRILAKKLGKRTRAEELIVLQEQLIAEYARFLESGKLPEGLARRSAVWYQAIIAPVIVTLAEDRTSRFILNVKNRRTIPWLPEEAIIEVPVLVEKGNIQALEVQPAPQAVRALVQLNCAYEMLAVEAIVEHNRDKALKALLINPIIRTYDQAAKTLEKAWTYPQ
jgi:6-phospho-beta-glucosidase